MRLALALHLHAGNGVLLKQALHVGPGAGAAGIRGAPPRPQRRPGRPRRVQRLSQAAHDGEICGGSGRGGDAGRARAAHVHCCRQQCMRAAAVWQRRSPSEAMPGRPINSRAASRCRAWHVCMLPGRMPGCRWAAVLPAAAGGCGHHRPGDSRCRGLRCALPVGVTPAPSSWSPAPSPQDHTHVVSCGAKPSRAGRQARRSQRRHRPDRC